MPIAEIFITALVTVLVEKLASGDLLSFARRVRVDANIRKWSDMLRKINFIISDAEDQQVKNKTVKLWLEELQDLAYDLDDVLDEFAIEQIKLKLDGLVSLESSSIKRKVKTLLPGRCFMFNSNMVSKMNEISTRLKSVTRQMKDLNLENIGRISANKPIQKTPSTSLVHVPTVCGRDEDINRIIEFLLRDGEPSQSDDEISVIPIVGMGGLGKTTLAQAVYNDNNVKKHFALRAWVCVSEDFDVMRITKAILESVTSRPCGFNNLDQIQVELRNSLAGRNFLIVLDDVWHKDYYDWSVLKSPFCNGTRGSKVVVTTRDQNVASLMGSSQHQQCFLQPLSFEDCWSVFAQHAFGNRNIIEYTNLVEIGKKIVDRCRGLPLSARALGGLLRCKESGIEWKAVLDSDVWWEKDNQILPSLQLSYHHLPSHLKPCFAFCAIFPKNYEFDKKELVYLWMAEGFVRQGRENRKLEDIGNDYFHELLARSLFQPSTMKKIPDSYVMHDLVNDLAQVISGDLCFRLEDGLEDFGRYKNLERARYSSFRQGEFDGVKKFESFFEATRLHTFLPLPSKDFPNYHLASILPSILFPKLSRLRALSLRGYHIHDNVIPDSIGRMKHLRYLDLSFTNIETLPDGVQKLYNLQTLLLRNCRTLKNFPKSIGSLTNLCYFDITSAHSLRDMPHGIGEMESLLMLSNFIVAKDMGSRIKELGKLRHLRGTLCISGLQNVTVDMDAKEACIIKKDNLEKLILVYAATSDDRATLDKLPNEGVEREVLHMLEPHNNLKELQICWYHGTRFPTWLEHPKLTNLVCLKIKDCTNCSVVPPLGQLMSLKELYLQGMSAVKHVGSEFYGQLIPKSFPSLETLSFTDLPVWEDWFTFPEDELQPFAYVSNLFIKNCPKLLGKLPTNLPSLKVLEIRGSQKLVFNLDDCVYPSLTSLSDNNIEFPFTPLLTHESSSLSPLGIEKVLVPDSSWNTSTSFQRLNSVIDLRISDIHKLGFLPKWLTHELTALKGLRINSCKELKTLLHYSNQLQQQLPVLQRLHIEQCPQLVTLFFLEKVMDRESGQQLASETVQSFMRRLEYLTIYSCDKLEKLPKGLYMLTCLVKLEIWSCDSLVSLPNTGFPPALKSLQVCWCKGFTSPILFLNNDHNLESLYVSHCPSLTCLISFPCINSIKTGGQPSSLIHLRIRECGNLEGLVLGEEKIHCPSLEDIYIVNCGRLKNLPDISSSDSLKKLKNLSLIGCGDLQYIPDGWFHAIPNMSQISIGIGGEMGVFSYIVKEVGSLINLTSLYLKGITTVVHPSEWGLHRMSSLKKLEIYGPMLVAREKEMVEVFVFPLEGMSLPTSLTKLLICGFPEMERLSSKGFQCLGSLEELDLYNCPRLAYFPEGGLPETLRKLCIGSCPIVGKKCEKGNGKYWPIISRIPFVHL